jgi:hypothetical protein
MSKSFKARLITKWWFRWIRSYTWFSYRYWWFNYLVWSVLIGILVWLIKDNNTSSVQCYKPQQINRIIQQIDGKLEKCCYCKIIEPALDTLVEQEELEEMDGLDSLREQYDACNGAITITLAWETSDDLDLHLIEPDGTKVYFGNKVSRNGAELDIDMNAGSISTKPIENICYRTKAPDGRYKVLVHYYKRKSYEQEIPYQIYIRLGSKKLYFQGVHSNENDLHLIYEFNNPA